MSDWIPTAERLPEYPDRNVIVQHRSSGVRYTLRSKSVNLSNHVAWQEMPESYVPPKPKRGEWRWKEGNTVRVTCPATSVDLDGCHLREVLPGDPDPDVVIEVLEGMGKVYKSMPQLTCISTWIKRIEESRSK